MSSSETKFGTWDKRYNNGMCAQSSEGEKELDGETCWKIPVMGQRNLANFSGPIIRGGPR
jgi:hypothetical protein